MKGSHRIGPHAADDRSFTLVEILVAMAVAVLLFAMLAQVLSLASRALNDDRRRMDAWDQARGVFDRIGFDWNGRVRSPQVPSFVVKNGTNGNDVMVLISATPSTTGDRLFSVVQYEIDATDADTKTLALQRGSLGFWSSTYSSSGGPPSGTVTNLSNLFQPSGFFSTASSSAPFGFPSSYASSTVTNLFQPLGDEVFAVSLAFLTSGYTNSSGAWEPPGIYALPPKLPVNPNWTNAWPAATTSTPNTVVDLTSTNIVAMVVGVAVLDAASRNLMSASQFSEMADKFVNIPTTSTNTPAVYWQQNILGIPGFYLNPPTKAYQAVKVYQRFYYAQ